MQRRLAQVDVLLRLVVDAREVHIRHELFVDLVGRAQRHLRGAEVVGTAEGGVVELAQLAGGQHDVHVVAHFLGHGRHYRALLHAARLQRRVDIAGGRQRLHRVAIAARFKAQANAGLGREFVGGQHLVERGVHAADRSVAEAEAFRQVFHVHARVLLAVVAGADRERADAVLGGQRVARAVVAGVAHFIEAVGGAGLEAVPFRRQVVGRVLVARFAAAEQAVGVAAQLGRGVVPHVQALHRQAQVAAQGAAGADQAAVDGIVVTDDEAAEALALDTDKGIARFDGRRFALAVDAAFVEVVQAAFDLPQAAHVALDADRAGKADARIAVRDAATAGVRGRAAFGFHRFDLAVQETVDAGFDLAAFQETVGQRAARQGCQHGCRQHAAGQFVVQLLHVFLLWSRLRVALY